MTTTLLNYGFSTQKTTPPGDEQIRCNAAPASATAVYIDYDTSSGEDASALLLALAVDDTLEIAGLADQTRWVEFTVTDVPVDMAGYVEVPVAPVGAGAALSNGACTLTLEQADVAPPEPLPQPPKPDVCSGPSHPPATVMKPGSFRIRFPAFTVEWGDHDLREDHTDGYVFCSFACLAAWATERSAQHDDQPVVEGEPPHPEHPIVLPEGVDVGE